MIAFVVGLSLGSIGAAFVMGWVVMAREEREARDDDAGGLRLENARLRVDLQRAWDLNKDYALAGLIGTGPFVEEREA